MKTDGVLQVPGLRKRYTDIESMPESEEERKKIVSRYCPLVLRIAAYFHKRGVPQPWTLEDLFQEGVVHLHKAIHLWRPERGKTFKSFAYMVVFQRLQKSVFVRRKYKDNLRLVPQDILEEAFAADQRPFDDDDWVAALETLSPKEGDIIIRHLGLDGNEPELIKNIAEDYGCSKQRISQIEQMALKKLKRWFQKRKGE